MLAKREGLTKVWVKSAITINPTVIICISINDNYFCYSSCRHHWDGEWMVLFSVTFALWWSPALSNLLDLELTGFYGEIGKRMKRKRIDKKTQSVDPGWEGESSIVLLKSKKDPRLFIQNLTFILNMDCAGAPGWNNKQASQVPGLGSLRSSGGDRDVKALRIQVAGTRMR